MSNTSTPQPNPLNSPKGILTGLAILLVIWGVFNPERVSMFFNGLFNMLINQVLPIVIVIGVIVWILKSVTKK